MVRSLYLFPALALLAALASSAAAAAPNVDRMLERGELATGERELMDYLKANPRDDEARFGLGVVQFLRAVETLAQTTTRYQPRQVGEWLPILRVGNEKNENPETVTYEKLRGLFDRFAADLSRSEATLADIQDKKVKLPIHLGRVRLDFNGDGKATDEERLWNLYASLNRNAGGTAAKEIEELLVAFDRADVSWLRGYCHLLTAFCEIVLAYDEHELFARVGHLLVEKPESPYPFLKEDSLLLGGRGGFLFQRPQDMLDLVATIHLVNFPLHSRERLASAQKHFTKVVELSRETFDALEAETDNDHEWIPNTAQESAVASVRITKEMIAGWREFLIEADDILAGRKLLPFWRGEKPRGINLKKVFLEPRDFDLVLWVQGSAAAPYVEEGPLTKPEVWTRINRVFRGEFIGFAIWFN